MVFFYTPKAFLKLSQAIINFTGCFFMNQTLNECFYHTLNSWTFTASVVSNLFHPLDYGCAFSRCLRPGRMAG